MTTGMEYNHYKLILSIMIWMLLVIEFCILSIDLYSYVTSYCIELTERVQNLKSQIGYIGIIPSK